MSVKKETCFFEWVLVVTAVVTVIIGGYENYTERRLPDYSILNLLHSYGYLKEYAVSYEPGKGIWRLAAWIGSFMMVLMMIYSIRKRVSRLQSYGSPRNWLSAHMFLGVMGPTLITFHTTFKFGGLIATSYWCMILTMIFGILGRYIYLQIPRGLAGAEMEESEIDSIIKTINEKISKYSGERSINDLAVLSDLNIKDRGLLSGLFFMFRTDIGTFWKIFQLKNILKKNYHLTGKARKKIISLIKRKAGLIRKKNYLVISHNLLHHWHVVHIPLAIVMFFIMFLHIAVYYLFRPITASVL